jgi:hypothetical protein
MILPRAASRNCAYSGFLGPQELGTSRFIRVNPLKSVARKFFGVGTVARLRLAMLGWTGEAPVPTQVFKL